MPLLDSMFHLFSFSRHGIHLFFSERKCGVVEKDPANIKSTIPPSALCVCYLKILGDFQVKNWLPHSLFMAYLWLMFDIQESCLAAHWCTSCQSSSYWSCSVTAEGDTHTCTQTNGGWQNVNAHGKNMNGSASEPSLVPSSSLTWLCDGKDPVHMQRWAQL